MLSIAEFAKNHNMDLFEVHDLTNTYSVWKRLKGHIHYVHGQKYLDDVALEVLSELVPKQDKKEEEEEKMTDKEILIRNVENYRISHKLTKQELSKKLGFNQNMITMFETQEKYLPSWDFLSKLSNIMNMSFADMFTLDKEQFGIKEESEKNQFYSKLLEAKDNEIEGLRKQLSQNVESGALKVVVNRTSQECTLYKDGKESDVQVIRLIPERGSVHIDVPINSVEWVD